MTDFEIKFLNKSKNNEPLSYAEIEEIRSADIDVEDRAALLAVCSLRANLKDNKGREPYALWRFIRYLTEIEMPMQIIDYSAMLFPGNDPYFSKQLTQSAFKIIQRQADLMIKNNKYANEEHKEWLENIVNGQLPYGFSVQKEVKNENKENQ